LSDSGFPVQIHDEANILALKQRHGVPSALAGCHTAFVEGYVIEGHVTADVIERLLRDRPQVAGLAVLGMPVGSPGMEISGQAAVASDVIAFEVTGNTRVFSEW
jgi:hypothetical protein